MCISCDWSSVDCTYAVARFNIDLEKYIDELRSVSQYFAQIKFRSKDALHSDESCERYLSQLKNAGAREFVNQFLKKDLCHGVIIV